MGGYSTLHISGIAVGYRATGARVDVGSLDKRSGSPGSSGSQFWEERPESNEALHLCHPPSSSHLQPAGQGYPLGAH